MWAWTRRARSAGPMWAGLGMTSTTMACRCGVMRRPRRRSASMTSGAVSSGALDMRTENSICNTMQKRQCEMERTGAIRTLRTGVALYTGPVPMRPRPPSSAPVPGPRRVIAAAVVAACRAAFAPVPAMAAHGAPAAHATGLARNGDAGLRYVPGRVLVRFHRAAGRSTQQAALGRVRGCPRGPVYGEPTVIVRLPAGSPVPDAVATLRATPGVAWAAPDGIARVAATPNDPKFAQQYAFKNTGAGGGLADADIDATEGWTFAGMGSFPATGGIRIGFVDTGIDTTHTEFQNKIKGCVHIEESSGDVLAGCKDGMGHGSHVAGIAAALTNNGVGVAGVSFDSPIWV